MNNLKLNQLLYESTSWKRLLDFMMDENIRQKNRLALLLKDNYQKHMLNDIETFQNNFLKEDEIIGILRNDVADLEKRLAANIFDDRQLVFEVVKRLKKLRANIMCAEQRFCRVKSDFNDYLFERIIYT